MATPSEHSSQRPNQTPSGNLVHKGTAVTACSTCRAKKVKCSGTVPCRYCSKRGLSCSISPHGPRRAYSVNKIVELESRLARYEGRDDCQNSQISQNKNERISSTSPATAPILGHPGPGTIATNLPSSTRHGDLQISPDGGIESPPPIPTVPTPRSFPEHAYALPSTHEPRPSSSRFSPQNSQTINTEFSLSSSHEFGRRVQEVLARTNSTRSGDISIVSPSSQLHGAQDKALPSLHLSPAHNSPYLPTEDEAFRLIEAVSFFVGQTQSHYDSRELFDRVGLLYESPSNTAQTTELWFLQVLLVFAIGKLLTADIEPEGCSLPGTALFEFVEQHFPSPSQQYRYGRLSVELNALAALYLQMINRKGEAFLYISSALKLALLYDYHQETPNQRSSRSEKAHISRLWWTIYMQERRLAVAIGTPSGIQDDLIKAPLPTDTPGFPSSSGMRTNIKIAQITGQVITNLYGTQHKTQEELVSNAQQIIKSLSNATKDIPLEQSLTLSREGSELTVRTSASLHLMAYQATLLAIRPIMLHMTKLILDGHRPSRDELESNSLSILSRVCSEAARRLLEVIITLKERNLLAIFGFFDGDAVFSAAFIMLLTKAFDSACEIDQRINPVPGLHEAVEMLQYLEDRGNVFIGQKSKEIQKVWKDLTSLLHLPDMLTTNNHGSLDLSWLGVKEPNRQGPGPPIFENNQDMEVEHGSLWYNDAMRPPNEWDTGQDGAAWSNIPELCTQTMDLMEELVNLPLGSFTE